MDVDAPLIQTEGIATVAKSNRYDYVCIVLNDSKTYSWISMGRDTRLAAPLEHFAIETERMANTLALAYNGAETDLDLTANAKKVSST